MTCVVAIISILFLNGVHGQVTVHKQHALGATTSVSSAPAADYTGAAAYNPTVLNPPPIPDPLPPMAFGIQLQKGGTPGVSIAQTGAFFGFSIEMSVVNQACNGCLVGKNSSYIAVPFLNLMANIQQRAGYIRIRVGGNTQETAKFVDTLPDGKMINKDVGSSSNPTQTPPLDYTTDLFILMKSISSFVNVRWFLGIPFFQTDPFDLSIAEQGQSILGDLLIGLQAGNEPDLYTRHGHRGADYTPQSYVDEFGALVAAMASDAHQTNRNILIGPSLANADWQPSQVWETGFVDTYSDNLAFLSVERYPTDNCYAQFGLGTYRDPQEVFANYLDHSAGQGLAGQYLDSTAYAQEKGKGLIMFETNTASCGGFAGISDSFGAALWALDYSMQLAYTNFSGALFHVGGQNVFYNVTPPTNQSTYHQWTVGPVYYAALVMAEALGASNTSQILDLDANAGNVYTPAYAIYENGDPVRVALFNYITDPTGGSTYTASIAIGGGETGQGNATPATVKVKYLAADSVSQKGNFTWAGQTFGDHFASDGRPMGNEDVQTVTCDQANNVCTITVPAPGFALVFLSDGAQTETDGVASTTFATSTYTKLDNTATVDQSVLETSNGHSGVDAHEFSSTSKGSQSGAIGVKASVGMALVAVGASACLALLWH
ncbi:hypothetical protein BDZ89DRAFT_967337 [Hymenopellis radicata]|nr:hypothetical protein BDZ89DRAFT_967337 [Hymenopellis radicata]